MPGVRTSAHLFPATVSRLEAAIKKRGAKIVAKVDHAAAAKAGGLELKPATVLIFGNPKLGTPLMHSSATDCEMIRLTPDQRKSRSMATSGLSAGGIS